MSNQFGSSKSFIEELAAVLAGKPGAGMYHDPSALNPSDSHSLATGFLCSRIQAEYRKSFGNVPGWVDKQATHHRVLVCQLAIQRGLTLPRDLPTSSPCSSESRAKLDPPPI